MYRDIKIGKSASPTKCSAWPMKILISTLNALATEMREALAGEIKQSISKKFNQLKEELFWWMRDSINMELKEL